MALTPMQYKSYVWPHNPRTYRITYQRQVAVQKVPFGRYALQNLGLTRRVMEGEGEFFGPEAYDEFRKLASVFYQEGPVYGDNVFEKCGINRDGAGEVGKPRYSNGKRHF